MPRAKWKRPTKTKYSGVDHFRVNLQNDSGKVMSIKVASEALRAKLQALQRRNKIKEFSISITDQHGQEKHYRSLEPEDFVDYQHVLTSGSSIGARKAVGDVHHMSITYTLKK